MLAIGEYSQVEGRCVSTKDETRINDKIQAKEVRLVANNGDQVGVVPLEQALSKAKESGLDLVEVAPQASPPVCKIMDYGRMVYEKKRSHRKHRHTPKIKELRLHPKTEKHDVDVRLRQARRFLERGDKVLVNMIFRGREMAHVDLGKKTLLEFAEQLSDIAKVEQHPKMQDRRMGLVLAQLKTSERKQMQKQKHQKDEGEE